MVCQQILEAYCVARHTPYPPTMEQPIQHFHRERFRGRIQRLYEQIGNVAPQLSRWGRYLTGKYNDSQYRDSRANVRGMNGSRPLTITRLERIAKVAQLTAVLNELGHHPRLAMPGPEKPNVSTVSGASRFAA
jgi:hypothetical protein